MLKEKEEVAKHRLPLILERILILRLNSQLTLNTILHQIYIITVTIISLIIILLKPEIAPNRIANWYTRLTFPLLFIQVVLIVIRVDILGSKESEKIDKKINLVISHQKLERVVNPTKKLGYYSFFSLKEKEFFLK